MQKIILFVRRFWVLILIVLVVALYSINKFLELKNPAPTPSPTQFSSTIADYKSLVPGKSTEENVNSLLGFPVEIKETEDKKITEYESSNKYRNNVVIIQGKTATFIKEVVNTNDNKNADNIINRFGPAPYILYRQLPSATFNLYVYPNNGIAYLGHEDGTILEIWYFEPVSLEEFIKRWGEGYSEEKYTEIPKY